MVLESPDLNPIEMRWRDHKRAVPRLIALGHQGNEAVL